MFDFSRIDEVVTDPRELAELDPSKAKGAKKRKFVEITMDTPLAALSKFLEWNSAAVVTEKVAGSEDGTGKTGKPVAVVTKVDLLTWMVRKKA
jgi:cystathionine beta-synthase